MGTQRRRLAPALRVAQILDAALQEFSASGYAGARMDDIALRAEPVKGGLYAHFSSKEAVFEALIARHLSQRRWTWRRWSTAPRPRAIWLNASSISSM